MSNRISGNLLVTGHFTPNSMTIPSNTATESIFRPGTALPRSLLALDALVPIAVPLLGAVVWDDPLSPLPDTPADDDLGLIAGTFGTDAITIQTGDLKAAGPTTRKARFLAALPNNYDPDGSLGLRIAAGMLTNAADGSALLDVEVYRPDRAGGVGSDLFAGTAVDVNSLVLDDYDYLLTPDDLAPGDLLDIVLSFAVNDGATGTAVIGLIADLQLLASIRG